MEIKTGTVLGNAAQGMQKAGRDAGDAARRITDGGELDARDVVDLKIAEVQFKASAKVFKVGADMQRHLLDVLA
ncbi:MAG: hypothetical protein QF893_21065 [Alphaproteobacteria bacterium]|jgi:hypothetical protein|nr:hypothetical protein [Alphaproteobacteria bacterium]